MEIRQLTTDHERRIFANRATEARATRGFGFRYIKLSHFEESLKFQTVYGIFETAHALADDMVAGFAMHDLASLPQSFSKPDLSHLPPSSVVEGGVLWSLSRGAAGVARQIAPVIVGILQAEAVLLYPLCKPVDLTSPHRELGFVNACEPIPNGLAQTLQGEPLWVQPVILEGEKLQAYVRWGFDCLFRNEDGRQVFNLDSRRPGRPMPISGPLQRDHASLRTDRISIPAV
jgi:hypothetical protein